MKEVIVKIVKSKAKNKKYAAIVRNKITGKERKINFGSSINEQYKDSTPLKLYSNLNHLDKQRRKNYFSRFSGGIKTKAAALIREKQKSEGLYNAKILSHIYLW